MPWTMPKDTPRPRRRGRGLRSGGGVGASGGLSMVVRPLAVEITQSTVGQVLRYCVGKACLDL